MPLPSSLIFSQASLQDYADCPRRFQLRYLLKVRWPAAHDGPIRDRMEHPAWEARAQLGSAFHRMVHQHMVGIPEEAIAATMPGPDEASGEASGPDGASGGTEKLRQWWKHYLQTPPEMPVALRQSEVRLTTPLGEPGSARYRLTARYDLLAIEPGKRAVIVDWKTNESRPPRARLAERWQTRVYRYVLVQAGAWLNDPDAAPRRRGASGGVQWKPSQVELVYWFANFPAQPEHFSYDDAQYTEDEWALKAAIGEIASRVEKEWPLTEDLKQCRYCTYRTLCDREKVDADEPDWEPGADQVLDLDIDLEQVAEIEF